MTHTPWTVDFWFDPACPLSRITSRWLVTVAEQRPITIRWRVMSLSVLNEGKDEDPEGDDAGYLWIPARVCAAVQTVHGHEALGDFYDALWTGDDGAQREWISDITDALRGAGLPEDLAEAGFSTDHDSDLRASHHEGIRRVHGDVGTPILAITGPGGSSRALFGPVITALPNPADALRLWEATLLLTSVPQFREIKT